MTGTVGDLATLVRSKNAGPFWLTLDIFCDTDTAYNRIAAPDVITPQHIADIYDTDPDSVRIFRLPQLRVVKVSFPRPTIQGAVADRDMHAGQQHIPLSLLPLPPSRWESGRVEPKSIDELPHRGAISGRDCRASDRST
jgi:hypothetical protein